MHRNFEETQIMGFCLVLLTNSHTGDGKLHYYYYYYLTHLFCKQRFAGSVPTVDINLLWSCHGKRFCRVSVVHFLLSPPPQYFNLKLSQFGPYRLDYSKTGRSVSCNIMQHMLICVKCFVSLLWRETDI